MTEVKKNYHAIGEVFELNGKKYRVEEWKGACSACAFYSREFHHECSILPCSKWYREDGTSVIFVEVKDEETKKRAPDDEMKRITRMMVLKKGETEYTHCCDIPMFIPNIHEGGKMLINGQFFSTVQYFDTTIDFDNNVIIQMILLKED